MASPSQTSGNQVNTEMGVASGTLLRTSNTWVNRVAANYIEEIYTTTGSTTTVTIPEGTTYITAYIWGGGGGSYRSGTTRSTGGGGAFLYARIPVGAATTFTTLVGVGGIAGGSGGGNGGLSRITINGIQYIAGGGQGGTLSAFGAAGTYSYTGGEANIIYVQEGYNGFRVIGGAASLVGGDAGGTTPVNYGGGTSTTGGANIPGAGAPVIDSVAQAGARGEIRVTFEKTAVKWSQLRNGINFPSRRLEKDAAAETNIPNYGTSNTAIISGYGQPGIISVGTATLTVNSNGAIYYDATGVGNSRYQKNWLTYGTNSEYTANFTLFTGSVTGSQTGTDLALSETRSWSLSSLANSSNLVDEDVALGILIIKYNGAVIVRRRFNLNTGGYYDSGF